MFRGRYEHTIDAKGRTNQAKVGRCIVLLLAFGYHFFSFLYQAGHTFTGLGPSGSAEELQAFGQPFRLGLGLGQMSIK